MCIMPNDTSELDEYLASIGKLPLEPMTYDEIKTLVDQVLKEE